jgi:hypothetical protein
MDPLHDNIKAFLALDYKLVTANRSEKYFQLSPQKN